MVNFKASLTINEAFEKIEEIRRFTIDSDVASSFFYLREKLQCIFPILRGKRFTITWKDVEGDSIIISSDEELHIALQESPESTNHKLYIKLQSDQDTNAYVQPEKEVGILHCNIICDSCNKNVKGFRYKCLACPDYDLCSECEGRGLHPEHCMLRIGDPLQWSSRQNKRFAHHVRKFFRSSDSHTGREEIARECPAMKDRHRRRRSPNCASNSMIETFLDILTDPPNYTGECPMGNVSKSPETATEATTLCNKTQSQETKTNQRVDLLKYVEDAIAPVLNHFGINVSVKVTDDEKSGVKPDNVSSTQTDLIGGPIINDKFAPKPNNVPRNQADSEGSPIINEKSSPKSNNAPKNQADSEEMPIKNEKCGPKPNNATTNQADSEEMPIINEKCGKSSDDDEWTIVNKEDKSSDFDAVQTLPPSSISLKHTNENMQEEDVNPSAPVTDLPNGNLYPPLPQSTAIPPTVTPPTVTPPTATKPTLYHTNPKIQSAVVSMMDMGFSNEGGWLTQLLEVKNGNINEVLDMLSPV